MKSQFLKSLYDALQGSMTKEQIYSHIQYYNEYIDKEMEKGFSEKEVVEKLGNPRLIAKTIMETEKTGGNYYNESTASEPAGIGTKQGIFSKLKKIITTIAIVLVVFLVLRFLFWLAIKLFIPVLIIVLAVKLISTLKGK
ncbi:MAG: DUF1700 domain-containing protein [Lachnospiraceae bacterium]|nr:DUF1700 domain-containing protein [Lachnospiraceae bacterium]